MSGPLERRHIMSRAKILMGLFLSLTTAAAWAQIGNFVIFDGECRYELGGLIGQRLGGNGGVGNLFGGGLDHLFQNWFWYRGAGDTREYALSNQIFGAAAGNQARIIYLEPINDGNTPNVLLFDLEY